MKKYIISAFALLLAIVNGAQAANTQSAVSPTGECKTFLNESYIPGEWRHISSCDGKTTKSTKKRRTVKTLPNYASRSRYVKTTPKKTTKKAVAKPSLRYLRPRKTSTKTPTTKNSTTRKPNYQSSYAKRYQLSNSYKKTKSTPKTTTNRYRQRNYSGVSAASAVKKNSTGVLSANTWSRTRNARIKNLDKNASSQFWRSRNSITAEKRAEQKIPDREVRAKLKQRFVGERRLGSLSNITTKN